MWVYPTPLEERAQVYTAIIHGATGLLHFAWDSCTLRAWDGNIYGGIRPDVKAALPDCPNGAVIARGPGGAGPRAVGLARCVEGRHQQGDRRR